MCAWSFCVAGLYWDKAWCEGWAQIAVDFAPTSGSHDSLLWFLHDFFFLQSLLICRGGRSFFGRKESFPPFGTGTGSDIATGRPLKDLSKHVNSQPISPLMGGREERYVERGWKRKIDRKNTYSALHVWLSQLTLSAGRELKMSPSSALSAESANEI